MLVRRAAFVFALLASACEEPSSFVLPHDTGDRPTVEDEEGPSWDSLAVLVNEFLAYDPPSSDWIEIYNRSAEPVAMAGMRLACEDSNPQEVFTFPDDLVIEPAGFAVVICDEEEGEGDGELHAPFRIERHQGTITLLDADDMAVNTVGYAYQDQGVSAARVPDGELTWIFEEEPTPGESNAAE